LSLFVAQKFELNPHPYSIEYNKHDTEYSSWSASRSNQSLEFCLILVMTLGISSKIGVLKVGPISKVPISPPQITLQIRVQNGGPMTHITPQINPQIRDPNGGPISPPKLRVPNRGLISPPKSGSQIGVLNRGPKSGSQIGVPNQGPKSGSQIGVPNRGPKSGSQIGVPNRVPDFRVSRSLSMMCGGKLELNCRPNGKSKQCCMPAYGRKKA
jgi:hypothetical protein